jgi:hypothetical protein
MAANNKTLAVHTPSIPVMKEVSRADGAELMRHENVATTAKYAHAFDEDVLAAMEAETAVRQQVPLQTPLQQADEDNQSVESTDKKAAG